MTTKLALHHVGEGVLAGLLDGLAKSNRLEAVRCVVHDECSLASVLGDSKVRPPYSFSVNAQLASTSVNGRKTAFDGEHCVDVMCSSGPRGFAIEAKLGMSGLTSGVFKDRFLGAPGWSNHKPPRVTGGMVALLNHRSIAGTAVKLTTSSPPVVLVPAWALAIRAETWKSWSRRRPQLSNAHVLVFEEIAAAFGDGDAFDRLVLERVGSGFHKAWEGFS